MDDLSNRVIKSYELKECVSAGGFGQVYRAYQPSVGREVAVKVILPQYANQPDFIRRFEVEAQLIAHLEHPHIVPLYDYWRDPDGAYLVMRWLKGSLRGAIQHGPWSVEAASRLLDEIAAALTVAHREGIVHRDIKPDNILLDEDENAYLADFGIAKDLSVSGQTEEGALVGSLTYITPEQIKGETVTSRSDIYSLGLVMYEILVSQKPFPDATTPVEWINIHLNSPLPHLNLQRPNLPAALNEVLQTATAKDPTHRYPNMLRFAAAFRATIPPAQRGPAQPLPEPLTERELAILKLMVEGMSSQDIAQKLFLTIGTVKWYVNQIYSKLDVHSRHQAVERAHQLKLLAPEGQATAASSVFPNVMTAPPQAEQSEVFPITVPHTDFINPYKGLRAFREADAHDFFGRAVLTEQLLTRLTDSNNPSQFLAVVGPSGSGKSSVVKAGLIPALRRGALPNSGRWFITEMLPGTHPLEELEAALMRVAVTSLPDLLGQLSGDRRGLVRAAKRVLPTDQDVELLLLIDQFEELFTHVADEAVRTHFIDNLLAAVTDPRSRVRVILTLRADFYDKPLLYPRLAELVRSHTEVVVPLTSQELERAILGPAERIRLQFEPGLVPTIVNDIGEQPGTLPLLQYTLTELFDRREGVTLTLNAYKDSGGISGSLARRADELYGDLDADGQAAARQLFLRLITLGEGTEDTRRRAPQSELILPGNERVLDDVIGAFVQYRLLTLDRDPVTRGPTVEIAHEALIREWGRLKGWLADSREDLRVQRRLMAATADWENSQYERSFLASGARLAQFDSLASESDLAMNASEKAYLDASIKEREQQMAQEQIRQAREKALERRSRNFLRGLVAVLLLATLGALGLTALAVSQSQKAQQNAVLADTNAAESQNVALVSGSQAALAKGDNDLAIALAMQAVTLNPQSDQAQVALGQAAYAPGTIRRFVGHSDNVESVVLSQDGRMAVSGSDDNTLILWDVATGQIIRRFVGHTGWVFCVAISPDGRTALSASQDKTLILWDLASGAIIRRFEGHSDAVRSVAFSPDGRTAISGANDTLVILWDVATGQIIRRFGPMSDPTNHILGVAFSPDGRTAIAGGLDGTVRLWDLATGQIIRSFEDNNNQIVKVAFSPDGRTFLTGTTTLNHWDVSSGQLIRRFYGHSGSVGGLAYSPDGHTAFSGDISGVVIEWNLDTGQLIKRLLGRESAGDLALGPDGHTLVEASGQYLRLWDLSEGQVIRAYAGQKGAGSVGNSVEGVALSPDGKQVLSGSNDGTAILRDVATGKELRRYTDPNANPISSVEFSPDGHSALLAMGGYIYDPHDIVLWNTETGEEIRRFTGHPMGVGAAHFSPDGRTVVSVGAGSTTILWDVQTGKEIRRFRGYETTNNDTFTSSMGGYFSPDGRTMVTIQKTNTFVVWDVATGQEIRHFGGGPDYSAWNASISADGRRLLAASGMSTALLWDMATGSILRNFTEHSGPIGGLTFSRDGRYALLGSGDSTTSLWDLQEGKLIRLFNSSSGGMTSSAFFPDDRSVIVQFADGNLALWRIDKSLDELIAWTRANRYVPDLTCEQRLTYRLVASCDTGEASPSATPGS